MHQSPAILSQNKQNSQQTSLLYKFVTIIISLTVAIVWIIFSKHYLNDIIRDNIFYKNLLKNFDHSIDLLSVIGLYAAIYLVSLTFTVMIIRILNHSINPAIMKRLEPAQKINEVIRNFTHFFIIFCCLFFYFLENSKKSVKISCGYILPLWFMSGYTALLVGNLLQLIFKRQIGIGKAGFFTILTTFVVLLAEINEFKLFKLI